VKSTAYKLIDIFYENGVIGVWRATTKTFVYSFEERDAQFMPRAFLETN
jgi:hypothetical protein